MKIEYEYSSTQINLPNELAREVIAWGDNQVAEEAILSRPNDMIGGRELEPHVTILHGIHGDDPNPIHRILKKFAKPFPVSLGKISIFRDNPDFNVLKIEAVSSYLFRLRRLFLDNMRATIRFPSYKPHVTIAYIKKGYCEELVGSSVFLGRSFRAEQVVFSGKSGLWLAFQL